MSIPSEFIPISALNPVPGPLTDDTLFIVSAAGVSYKARARDLVLPTDPVVTAIDFTANLPASRYLVAGPGISIVDGGAGQPLTISGSTSGSIIVFDQSVDAALNATTDNWDPTGWDAGSGKSRLRVTPAAAVLLNGLDASAVVDGQTIALYNDSATQMLRLVHQAGTSLADNRFTCPGGANFTMVPYQCILIQKNGSNGWRLLT